MRDGAAVVGAVVGACVGLDDGEVVGGEEVGPKVG